MKCDTFGYAKSILVDLIITARANGDCLACSDIVNVDTISGQVYKYIYRDSGICPACVDQIDENNASSLDKTLGNFVPKGNKYEAVEAHEKLDPRFFVTNDIPTSTSFGRMKDIK